MQQKLLRAFYNFFHNFYRFKMEGGRRPKSANLQVNIFILHRITMYKGFLLIQFVFFRAFALVSIDFVLSLSVFKMNRAQKCSLQIQKYWKDGLVNPAYNCVQHIVISTSMLCPHLILVWILFSYVFLPHTMLLTLYKKLVEQEEMARTLLPWSYTTHILYEQVSLK